MPTPVISSVHKGIVGKAKVTVRRDDITVEFEDSKLGTVKNIPVENAPAWMRSGKYLITMDEDNLKILYANLPAGIYFAKFKEFLRDEDTNLPRIKEIEAKSFAKWDRPRHLEFFVTFEVVDNLKYAGTIITYPLWYVFKQYEETRTAISGTGQKKVLTFLDACGYDYLNGEDITWSDNVLPEYEKLLLKAGKKVGISINERGFVSQISKLEGDD